MVRHSTKRKLAETPSIDEPGAKTARCQKTLTDLPLELLQPMVTGLGLNDRMAHLYKQLLVAERGAGEHDDKDRWESIEADFNTPGASALINGLYSTSSYSEYADLELKHQPLDDRNPRTSVDDDSELMRGVFCRFRNVTLTLDTHPSQILTIYQGVLGSSITNFTWNIDSSGMRAFAEQVMGIGPKFFAAVRKSSITTSKETGEVYRSEKGEKAPYCLVMLHDGWKTKISRHKPSKSVPYIQSITVEKGKQISLTEHGARFVRIPYAPVE
ncbi:hypothetical protein PMAYCL1PPCAC_05592 [Pristionchus mayeri]|uniref:Uncharacterized protein n=1 Tax=Pristionchus mayeri TaxID=1317129 RepID=A0AAN4ZCU0_9BILA|nr:hypothetical protein PMAYCL1PPCAC_05592 [Pristionchus mayeri]